jgi:hypothetical protein
MLPCLAKQYLLMGVWHSHIPEATVRQEITVTVMFLTPPLPLVPFLFSRDMFDENKDPDTGPCACSLGS